MTSIDIKRSEIKYYVNRQDSMWLQRRLPALLSYDPHCGQGKGYLIRSVYFDSFDDECLADKQSGVMLRKKYRIRSYGVDSERVKFEIKHKLNNQVYKESVFINRETAKAMISGDYSGMLDSDNPILHKAYCRFVTCRYTPKVVVDYHRLAFVYPHFNVRITLDYDLRSQCHKFDLFTIDPARVPVILEDRRILEVKFDKVLPDFIIELMGLSRHERMAISKYALSRRFFKTRKWEDN